MTSELAPELSVRALWHDSAATVAVQGEIDLSTVECFSASLAEIISRKPHRLTIDLTGVEFLDSSGLHAFVRARRELPEHCPIILRSPRRQVRNVFEITGLSPVFTFE